MNRSYRVQSHLITPQTHTASHIVSGMSRTFLLKVRSEQDETLIGFFTGIFETEDMPIMQDIHAQTANVDLLDLAPLILLRNSRAILRGGKCADRSRKKPFKQDELMYIVGVKSTIILCVTTGISGVWIEESTG